VKIYVNNLAENVSEDDLRNSFEKYGDVESVELQKHRFGDKRRGYAYLDMPSDEDAMKAMKALYGHNIKGNPIKVNQARTGSQDRRVSPRGGRRLTDSPII